MPGYKGLRSMKKIVFLFPGQGSQYPGMGQELYQEFGFVREIFEMADEVCKKHVSRLCFKGPMESLTETANLQPAITAVNLACLAAVRSEGIEPEVSAGHSLGEFSALAAAGVFGFPEAITLVNKRGELMHAESLKYKGSMAAVIGLEIDVVRNLVLQVAATFGGPGEGLSVANHNAKNQIVVSGGVNSVKEFSRLVKEKKGRAVTLKVSGAWHSNLMEGAVQAFSEFVETFEMNPPRHKVILNVTGEFADNLSYNMDGNPADKLTDGMTDIRENIVRQLCSPVQWYDTMIKCIDQGADTFVELGPGTVLTGLLKKTLPEDFSGKVYNVADLKSLELFLKDVK
jgi:[acyl-carrier-protein] S-malonyltransferase